jgi:myosin heavy subunit
MEVSCIFYNGLQYCRKVYCAHLGTCVVAYPNKLRHEEMYDSNNDRNRVINIPLLITTTMYKAFVPVMDDVPKQVLVIMNEDQKIYLSAEHPQQMDDWIRIIDDTIDTLKKEREAQIKQEEDFKRQQREATERQKQIQQEGLKEKQTEEPVESTVSETATNVVYVTKTVETFDFATQTEQDQESTLHEVRTMDKQFRLVKAAMLNARSEQETLQKHMAELIKYVSILRQEEKTKIGSIQEKLRRESERALEEEQMRAQSAALEIEVRKRDKQIQLLQEQVKKGQENTIRVQEEGRMLSDNLRDHVARISMDMSRLNNENKRLERELEIYKRGPLSRKPSLPPTPTQRGTGSPFFITDPREEAQEVQNQLQKIIAELSERLADKEEEIEHLRNTNIQLKSSGFDVLPPRRTSAPEKPLPPPPSVTHRTRYLLTPYEYN